MSTEPFIGEIKIFGFNFSPISYDFCNGQTYSIAQYTALFSLIGTTYGGNGQTTFNLPNLQGRVPIGQGQGPGLPNYVIGEQAGANSVTLINGNMPPHVHPGQGINVNIPVAAGSGDTDVPNGAFLAQATGDFYSSVSTAGNNYGPLAISGQTGIAGSGFPLNITNPYLALNYCIAVEGIFPSRN
jgi:microcystin-dependent protein